MSASPGAGCVGAVVAVTSVVSAGRCEASIVAGRVIQHVGKAAW